MEPVKRRKLNSDLREGDGFDIPNTPVLENKKPLPEYSEVAPSSTSEPTDSSSQTEKQADATAETTINNPTLINTQQNRQPPDTLNASAGPNVRNNDPVRQRPGSSGAGFISQQSQQQQFQSNTGAPQAGVSNTQRPMSQGPYFPPVGGGGPMPMQIPMQMQQFWRGFPGYGMPGQFPMGPGMGMPMMPGAGVPNHNMMGIRGGGGRNGFPNNTASQGIAEQGQHNTSTSSPDKTKFRGRNGMHPPPGDKSPQQITGHPPIPLYMSCDDDSLSAFQCLVRRQIEMFEARTEDVESNAQGRNKPITLGQVGIRCRHCTSLQARQRARGSVYYPSKLQGLYQAAQNMATIHLVETCKSIPEQVRAELRNIKERKSSAGGGKAYWGNGARVLGVVETEDCLRFRRR